MTDKQPCTGADDPRERCGRHHPLAILDDRTCCCDAPWLRAKNQCFSGAGQGDPVTLKTKLEAMLGYTVADAPQDVGAHIEGVMDVLAQHSAVPDDYRQRVAEAIAAKFTYPVYRCDRDGENERVENPGPADRIDKTPYVMVTAGDGCRSFWTPTCAELADAIVAVRDQDAETLRSENEDLRKRADAAEVSNARVRQLHGEIPYKRGSCYCANPYPCPTIRALDGEDTDRG